MTCKDCIHLEVCQYYTTEMLGEKRAKELIPSLTEHGRICERYADRSRFVELPADDENY